MTTAEEASGCVRMEHGQGDRHNAAVRPGSRPGSGSGRAATSGLASTGRCGAPLAVCSEPERMRRQNRAAAILERRRFFWEAVTGCNAARWRQAREAFGEHGARYRVPELNKQHQMALPAPPPPPTHTLDAAHRACVEAQFRGDRHEELRQLRLLLQRLAGERGDGVVLRRCEQDRGPDTSHAGHLGR